MGQCSLKRGRWTRVRAESGNGRLGQEMRGQIVRGSVGRVVSIPLEVGSNLREVGQNIEMAGSMENWVVAPY